jgi:hypothetical protein
MLGAVIDDADQSTLAVTGGFQFSSTIQRHPVHRMVVAREQISGSPHCANLVGSVAVAVSVTRDGRIRRYWRRNLDPCDLNP